MHQVGGVGNGSRPLKLIIHPCVHNHVKSYQNGGINLQKWVLSMMRHSRGVYNLLSIGTSAEIKV